MTITYARVGGPPDDWHMLEVIDLETGQEVTDVIEVNVVGGWVRRIKRDVNGFLMKDPHGGCVTETIFRSALEIRRKEW